MTNRKSYLSGTRVIEIEPVLSDKTLTTHVRFTKDLRRFFRSSQFDLHYEEEITAGDGILSVPGVALLLPIAWLTGSDLRVSRLDRTFAAAAQVLQAKYGEIYPKMPFGTRLLIEELTDSAPNPAGTALLFSGGLDATYSFFANRDRCPSLIQVFGTEFPLSETKFEGQLRKESQAFAGRHGTDISFIRTNFFDLRDPRCVAHRFLPLRQGLQGSLWKGLGYSLGFLAMTAPLSAGRFNQLIIAAWANREHADRMHENPDCSSPGVDENIAWSNLSVEHHGCLHRYEKARAMKDWLPGNPLRVCWDFRKAIEIGGGHELQQV